MKGVLKIWFGILLCTAASIGTAFGQTQPKAVAAPNFAPFWAKWQAAVASDDKETVAGMTHFPLYARSNLDKPGFLKAYPSIFDAKTKACFKKEKPFADPAGVYNVFCGETIYTFSLMNGAYLFTDIGAND